MDVFISWSGPQSKQVAEALRHFLPRMIQTIKPWLSSSDIEAGARWAIDIAENLQKSKVGILCLTPANLDAPWIHFEAGALAKTIEHTFVCPYLTGLKESDVKGPLTQFQMKPADEEGTRALLETLNRALKETALQPDALAEAFSMWWPKLKEKLDAIPQQEPAPKKRPIEDMLEELLELARRQARQSSPVTRRLARTTEEMIRQLAEETLGPGFQVDVTRVEGGGFTFNVGIDGITGATISGELQSSADLAKIRELFSRIRDQARVGTIPK